MSWGHAVTVGLAVLASAYSAAFTIRRRQALRPSARRWRDALCFAAAWTVLVVALLSPLDRVSEILFAAHMAQHELLMLVAAPLFVLARPLAVLPWALPRSMRMRAFRRARHAGLQTAWQHVTAPFTTLIVHGVIVWIAHLPALFEAALAHDGVHAVQHALFFWSAALFWWAVVHGRYGRLGYGVSVIFVFVTGLHTGLLGALLTFAPHAWYPTAAGRAAAAGHDPLDDQQLAGLLMWIPAGTLFMLIGLALAAVWLGEADRRTRAFPEGLNLEA